MNRSELQRLSQRVDSILDEIHAGDDVGAQQRAEELARALMDLYAVGLARVVELADATLLRRMADDEVVGGLLLLHDLHPDDVDTRIQAALDRVRPYLGSHAGGIGYDGVDEEGVAHLTLQGSCDGCPSSAVTVTLSVEAAVLEAAPEVTSVDVAGMVADPPEQPVFQIGLRPGLEHAAGTPPKRPPGPGGSWEHLEETPAEGTVSDATVGGVRIVLATLHGTAYAYLADCPHCHADLTGGTVVGDALGCPSCGSRYDVRLAGKGLGQDVGHLVALPVLSDGPGWRVALPTGVPA